MNLRRVLAMAYKEMLQVWRDPRSLAIALLMPLMRVASSRSDESRGSVAGNPRVFTIMRLQAGGSLLDNARRGASGLLPVSAKGKGPVGPFL